MFTLTIRDFLKCSHSLKGEVFGPAQLLHVITYDVEVTYITDALDEHQLVVDFAAAQKSLSELVAALNFKNLDEVEDLNGTNTTTEFLCQYFHRKICDSVRDVFQGTLRVTMKESTVAWTSYEAPVT